VKRLAEAAVVLTGRDVGYGDWTVYVTMGTGWGSGRDARAAFAQPPPPLPAAGAPAAWVRIGAQTAAARRTAAIRSSHITGLSR